MDKNKIQSFGQFKENLNISDASDSLDGMSSSEIKRCIMNNFVATKSNIEKLGDVFSIENVMKLFPDADFSKGEDKHGTTPAMVLRGKSFWIIESPRYKKGIKCWLSQVNSNVGKEIVCETVADLVSALNIT